MEKRISNLEKLYEVLSTIPPERRALNVWLALLDELLDKHIPIANAMVLAGQRLQEKQEEHKGELFHPADLYLTTEDINLFLRRRPEYQQRTKGWAATNKR